MTLRRSGVRRRPPRNTGPTAEVVALVYQRDRGRCAGCAQPCTGTRGVDHSLHHRLPRKAGGTSRPWVNQPANLILLCGHGSAGCHGRVESERLWAEGHGFIVREGVLTPERWPVQHAVHGLVWLLDDGGWLPR